MSRINTNTSALIGLRHLGRNYGELDIRLQRLSTGLRINRGRDDPAGLIISERLRSETRALQQAIDNTVRAANVVMTAEGALNETSALLLDLQGLIVASSNEAGISHEELNANQLQLDSILASIDRIANTTAFAGKKLLDGSHAYLQSSVPAAALHSVAIYSAYVPQGSIRNVTVRITQSAQTAKVSFLGSKTNALSTTSAVTVEIKGLLGTDILSFASGSTLRDIRTAVNNLAAATGVSAVVSTPAAGNIRSALLLHSTAFGSDAFVSVTPISGNFIVTGNANVVTRDIGQDAGVLVDGIVAAAKGLRADVRGQGLDARFYLNSTFAQRLSSASFSVTGGGAVFQLGPQINPNAQANLGFNSIATSQLGTAVTGLLYTLGSGQTNGLTTRRFDVAQRILNEAIDQVSSYRGRLGNFHRNQLDPNIAAQSVTLENVTAAESLIRDADIAEEVSALTRAQILVQSTQATLQIANSLPGQVLALLG